MSEPFAHTSGPRDAKLVLLGEAFGESEEQHGVPFAGQSGRELFRMLADAWQEPAAREAAGMRSDKDWLQARDQWLARQGILLTNVFASRPPKNNLGAWCGAKGEMEDGYNLPPVRTENPRYIRSRYAVPELQRLASELAAAPRHLCLCLGATALWSLTGSAAIGALRGATGEGRVLLAGQGPQGPSGTRDVRDASKADLDAAGGAGPAGGVASSRVAERAGEPRHGGLELGGGSDAAIRQDLLCGLRSSGDAGEASHACDAPRPAFKLLPTYHPAAVLRSWHWRPIVLADLLKGDRERRHPELIRPRRRIRISPSIGEVEAWTRGALADARLLAPDIETLNGQIRCIGFARSKEDVLVIPFVRGLRGGSYWGEEDHELRAWACVRALLESEIPKVGQNFLFDLTYLSRVGIRPRNIRHDTMLLHHVLFPEMQKGLGFLGSVYTNESAWKLMRRHGEELKRDE